MVDRNEQRERLGALADELLELPTREVGVFCLELIREMTIRGYRLEWLGRDAWQFRDEETFRPPIRLDDAPS